MTLLERIEANRRKADNRYDPNVNRTVNLRDGQSPWVRVRVKSDTPSKGWY